MFILSYLIKNSASSIPLTWLSSIKPKARSIIICRTGKIKTIKFGSGLIHQKAKKLNQIKREKCL